MHYQRSPEGLKASAERISRKHRQERADYPARFVLMDARASDRKRGFSSNDLDLTFVEQLMQDGCSYCGTRVLRISLDRLDNAKSHDKSNVVACCFRCNYIRNSMPYEAWLIIVPAVRAAYEKGLFGNWRETPFNKKAEPEPGVEPGCL
jgi:hypothetical protein